MKIQHPKLIIGGSLIGSLFLGSVFWSFRSKKRDECAMKFVKELNKELKPATQGLKDFKTFDIHYKDKVMKNPPKNLYIIRDETALKHAETIQNAWSVWDDAEEKVYGVFRSLKNHVQGSQVAKAYQDEYQVSLLDDISIRMNDKEILAIRNILKTYPNYA